MVVAAGRGSACSLTATCRSLRRAIVVCRPAAAPRWPDAARAPPRPLRTRRAVYQKVESPMLNTVFQEQHLAPRSPASLAPRPSKVAPGCAWLRFFRRPAPAQPPPCRPRVPRLLRLIRPRRNGRRLTASSPTPPLRGRAWYCVELQVFFSRHAQPARGLGRQPDAECTAATRTTAEQEQWTHAIGPWRALALFGALWQIKNKIPGRTAAARLAAER